MEDLNFYYASYSRCVSDLASRRALVYTFYVHSPAVAGYTTMS